MNIKSYIQKKPEFQISNSILQPSAKKKLLGIKVTLCDLKSPQESRNPIDFCEM
jgi:hypothetical protein